MFTQECEWKMYAALNTLVSWHSIFFLSNNMCAGDELGWDFVSMVKHLRYSSPHSVMK